MHPGDPRNPPVCSRRIGLRSATFNVVPPLLANAYAALLRSRVGRYGIALADEEPLGDLGFPRALFVMLTPRDGGHEEAPTELLIATVTEALDR
jgi:hypothetical protein